jgi:hypothetical protein
MKLVLLVIAATCAVARADDCPAPTRIEERLPADASFADLTAWLETFSCKNLVYTSELGRLATRVHVVMPKPLSPAQALQLFVDAIEAMGLVVTVKPATIIIKRPHHCPDFDDPVPALKPWPGPPIESGL